MLVVRGVKISGAKLEDIIPQITSGVADKIIPLVRAEFAGNFARQGLNDPWNPLLPSTVASKRRRGYAGATSILMGTLKLKGSLAGEGGPHSFTSITNDGCDYTIILGTDLPYLVFAEEGFRARVSKRLRVTGKFEGRSTRRVSPRHVVGIANRDIEGFTRTLLAGLIPKA
jgi:hypothetical protein